MSTPLWILLGIIGWLLLCAAGIWVAVRAGKNFEIEEERRGRRSADQTTGKGRDA